MPDEHGTSQPQGTSVSETSPDSKSAHERAEGDTTQKTTQRPAAADTLTAGADAARIQGSPTAPNWVVVPRDNDGPQRSKAKEAREWLQVGILIVATAWGVYAFFTKELTLPARRPAALQVTPAIDELGRRGQLALVRARLTVSNQTQNTVYVPGFMSVVHGIKYGAQAQRDSEFAVSMRLLLADSLRDESQFRARYSRAARSQVIAEWINPYMETRFEPGADGIFEHVFLVPVDSFDVVRLMVHYYLSKSVDQIDHVKWEVSPRGGISSDVYLRRTRGQKGSHAELYDFLADTIDWHRKWAKDNGFVSGLSVATASLWMSGKP